MCKQLIDKFTKHKKRIYKIGLLLLEARNMSMMHLFNVTLAEEGTPMHLSLKTYKIYEAPVSMKPFFLPNCRATSGHANIHTE